MSSVKCATSAAEEKSASIVGGQRRTELGSGQQVALRGRDSNPMIGIVRYEYLLLIIYFRKFRNRSSTMYRTDGRLIFSHAAEVAQQAV